MTDPQPDLPTVEAVVETMSKARHPEGYWAQGYTEPPEADDETVARAVLALFAPPVTTRDALIEAGIVNNGPKRVVVKAVDAILASGAVLDLDTVKREAQADLYDQLADAAPLYWGFPSEDAREFRRRALELRGATP